MLRYLRHLPPLISSGSRA